MSLSFPSSTRAIKANGRRLSLVGLTLALLLVAAWVGWLFQGTITLYETSSPLRVNRNTLLATPVVAATFPASAFAYIQQGQEAYLWLEGDSAQSPIPLLVQIYDIQSGSEHQPLQTTIWIPSYDAIAALPTGPLTGRVRIVTGQVRPITLLLQQAGWLATSPTIQNHAVGTIPSAPHAPPQRMQSPVQKIPCSDSDGLFCPAICKGVAMRESPTFSGVP